MPPKKTPSTLTPAVIESRIHDIRGQRVMLDSDLAELYVVETKALNQAVDRNPDRSPIDFAFRLTQEEFINLKSQIVTSSSGYGGRRKLPRVFTEQGVAMLSSVLRSEAAARVNVEIMRAFVRMRRLFATPGDIIAQLQKLSETVQLCDTQIKGIIDVLRKMMEPLPADSPKRRIGFATTDHDTPPKDQP